MDDRRFDALVKGLATGVSRRRMLKGLLGLGGAAALGSTVLEESDAATRSTPTPKPVKCPGKQIASGGQCVCPGGLSKCGPSCCNPVGTGAAHSECCDNACCNGTCYGEEQCCPYPRAYCPTTGQCCPTGYRCCAGVGCILESQCCSDTDCGDPCQACNPETRTCGPRCGAGERCCSGGQGTTCVAGTCCDSSDCPPIDACTSNTCENNRCVATRISCDDGNACTVDSCDPQLGCVYSAVECNDNNACTIDRCDPDRGCIYTKVDCDDGDPCTIDSCDAATGCVYTPVDCSALNNPEQCLVGVCAGGTCTAQSTCAAGTTCCGGGVCAESCECVEDGNVCLVNSDCCDGCCIAVLSTEQWEDICRAAGLIGAAIQFCAQAIEESYAGTCLDPPEVIFPGLSNNTITLPCAG